MLGSGEALLYYLGAGASKEVLPLASEFPERLTSFASELKEAEPEHHLGDPPASEDDPWGEPSNALFDAAKWLADEASRHASVDTFAKKLFFRNDEQALRRLKATLSAYLLIEQSRHPAGKRYDAFLATLLERDTERDYPRLPENIRIVTWNYDTQLEKSFYGFCEDQRFVQERITANPSIYRVNGCCAFGMENRLVWGVTDTPAWETGIKLFWSYLRDPPANEHLRFAWEEATGTGALRTGLRLHEVTSIVVIGYSFPYFNREIDHLIFSELAEADLKRVYLQYPKGSHASIEERLGTLLPKDNAKIIRVTGTEMFYIPDDLWKLP
jgi:hypothetical protein